MAPPNSSIGSTKGVVPAEWPAQAADVIVDSITKVREKTTRPAIVAARALVYGLIAGVVGLVATVLALTLVIRIGDNYLPGGVWVMYLVLCCVMTTAGLVLLRKANAQPPFPSA